jgi:hypothetical protein
MDVQIQSAALSAAKIFEKQLPARPGAPLGCRHGVARLSAQGIQNPCSGR